MRLRWAAISDGLRSSLFFEPMLFVVGAILLGILMLQVDEALSLQSGDLPLGVLSTVGSARAVLSTIAGATMTVAGISFSVALLVVQQASNQYSPRVVQGLFRDTFNKRVMGLVVGTFTYCLVVLRSVRSPLEDGGEPVIPNVSVALAVLLGVTSILAIVAFINHNAHSMEVSEILDTVSRQTIERLSATWSEAAGSEPEQHGEPLPSATALDAEPFVVTLHRHGWMQYIDHEALLAGLPEHTTARLECGVGHYAIVGAALCSISPPPQDVERVEKVVRDSVRIGVTRTMAQDAAYGVRQLADVGLRALSTGVNDPTTAHDAIVHLGAVLAEVYRRQPPPVRRSDDAGRVLIDGRALGHAEITALAFEEIRQAAAPQPRTVMHLLDTMATLLDSLTPHECNGCERELHRQAALSVTGCERADVLPDDLTKVRALYRERFTSADATS